MKRNLSKEELEKRINEDANSYAASDKDEQIILRKRLLENIFIYCRDHTNWQFNVPKDERKVFHYTVEVVEWFEKSIENFVPGEKQFTHYMNAGLATYCPKPKRNQIYKMSMFGEKFSIPAKKQQSFIRIETETMKLMASGILKPELSSWKKNDVGTISQECGVTENIVKEYIIFKSHNFVDASMLDTDSPEYLSEGSIKNSEFDKICETITLIFNKEKSYRRQYISKLITLHFVDKIKPYKLDYPFIDKEYAEKLDEEYRKTEKYPSVTDLGEEYGDRNPTQTLERFRKKVRNLRAYPQIGNSR